MLRSALLNVMTAAARKAGRSLKRDYGEVENVHLLSAEKPHYFFSSVGPGLRYKLSNHFSLRFDYGWQLLDSGLNPERQHSRAHLGLVATY